MWDKVLCEMQTDRTVKQIQDHWCDRQKECIALLESMGPAPRFLCWSTCCYSQERNWIWILKASNFQSRIQPRSLARGGGISQKTNKSKFCQGRFKRRVIFVGSASSVLSLQNQDFRFILRSVITKSIAIYLSVFVHLTEAEEVIGWPRSDSERTHTSVMSVFER